MQVWTTHVLLLWKLHVDNKVLRTTEYNLGLTVHVINKLLFLGNSSLIRNRTQPAVISMINQHILYRLHASYARQHTFSNNFVMVTFEVHNFLLPITQNIKSV